MGVCIAFPLSLLLYIDRNYKYDYFHGIDDIYISMPGCVKAMGTLCIYLICFPTSIHPSSLRVDTAGVATPLVTFSRAHMRAHHGNCFESCLGG